MRAILLAILMSFLPVAASARAQAQPSEKPLRVVVTVAPLRGIIEPLLPKGSSIKVLMPPGRSEHGYEFSAADLRELAKADLVFYVGLGLEPRLESLLSKDPRPTRVAACFADAAGIKAEPAEHEHHDDPTHAEDEHEHPLDPHLWLDPVLVKQVVPKLAAAVHRAGGSESKPDAALNPALAKRADDHAARIGTVDEEYRQKLAPFKGRAIVTHHNAFPRLADRYGLRVAAVIRGLENAEPSPEKMEEVVKAIKKEQVPTIFVEPQYSAGLAERIAREAGVKVSRIDPIGDGDWFKLMERNLESLVKGLSTK